VNLTRLSEINSWHMSCSFSRSSVDFNGLHSMVDTSANTAPMTSMIFKIKPLAAQLYRVLLITVVFSFLKPSEVHDSDGLCSSPWSVVHESLRFRAGGHPG
jgi:hypothetical protein